MSLIFSKELLQSSISGDDASLCFEKFDNPPRTLYDEIISEQQQKEEMDWQSIVYRLQVENTGLVNSLQETNQDLLQSRREKAELEQFIQRQSTSADQLREQLIQQQKAHEETKNQLLDLIYQKNYILMENELLKERYSIPHIIAKHY